MKILISESQYNRILLEDALELTERISDHYEDRKKRIQESLNVVFEYGGPKNLIQTFGDSIPRLWNPSTNSLEKFVKPDKNMALGDSYIVGKFIGLSIDIIIGIWLIFSVCALVTLSDVP